MITHTEFSGYGPHGLCTYISRENLNHCLEWVQEYGSRFNILGWDPEILNKPSGRTGTNHALHRIRERETSTLICLGWYPEKVVDSVQSIIDLSTAVRAIKYLQQPSHLQETKAALEIIIHNTSHAGFSIGADFLPELWDAIENENGRFNTCISIITQKIRSYYEGRYNRPQYGELITPFKGIDGYTLQFNQPHGNGVWMVGSRKNTNGSHQFLDHNTDTAQQVYDHIVVMCILLQECRSLIGSASYIDSRI